VLKVNGSTKMKKVFVISLILFLFPTMTYSQILNSYGVKLGTVISSPTWTKASENDSKVKNISAFDIGGFISLQFLKNLSIVPELHFLQKGFKYPVQVTSLYQPNGTGEYYYTKSSASYLSLPLNISWIFYKVSFDLYIYGGARFDFVIDKQGNEWQYYFDRFKNSDFGLSTGIGIRTREIIGIGTGLEFRYSPNITESYSDDYEQIKNKSFEILLVIYN
jgi:hypothetical protein